MKRTCAAVLTMCHLRSGSLTFRESDASPAVQGCFLAPPPSSVLRKIPTSNLHPQTKIPKILQYFCGETNFILELTIKASHDHKKRDT